MRSVVRIPCLAFALAAAGATTLSGGSAQAEPRAEREELARARALDKEGARAYGEGRYEDAIVAFEEAYRLGGPAFELWNIAKCYLRLDRPDQAAEMLERYLALPNLPKDDRAGASQQLEALKRRPSTLTITSIPSGAEVSVDGKRVEGSSPVTVSVPPGVHTVIVTSEGRDPVARDVEARYGRAIVVDVTEREDVDDRRPPPPPNPYGRARTSSIALRAAVGLVFPRWGSIGGAAGLGFVALGTHRVAEVGRMTLGAGGLLSLATDAWDNRTGAPNEAPGCATPIPNAQSATALSLFGIGTASVSITPVLRGTAIGGLGLAAYAVDHVGGDLFVPSCTASPGLRPAIFVGAELDWVLANRVRLSAFPLTWQIQSAFDGTRSAPNDAGGVWMRFGLGVGAGVDL